jgi:ATP-dependent Lon protease
MCFHGPPGVGKTSLGKSIAEALGRKFYRLALGGVRDEAEIRGHRRTYVGAMPGVIINSLKKVKSSNPVFLLDEIDKMGRDARGDPGAALLEVLDPAQNNKFTDHFLATPFDLSDIMFIATANSLDTIHPALLDRMEVIEISGYSLEEKLEIAKKYILPRQIKENGITDKVIQIKEKELKQIIIEYTAESGVRNLERAIGSVCRVVAYKYAISSDPETFKRVTVDDTLITDALGNNTSDVLLNERIQTPGTAIGLAYTANGGRALLIETTKYPGSGKLILTGQLGDVMKESIGTSLSWIRSNAVRLGLVPQL